MTERTLAGLLYLLFVVSGCGSTDASGPRFSSNFSRPPSPMAQIFVFRKRVSYAIQAPRVVRPVVFVDDQPIGELLNGGYVSTTTLPGRHCVVIGNPHDPTTNCFVAPPDISLFFEVSDKSLMARVSVPAPAMVTDSIADPLRIPFRWIVESGEDQSRPQGEGKTWKLEAVVPAVALPVIRNLAQSN